MKIQKLQQHFKKFPITFFILAINTIIFLLTFLKIIDPIVSLPKIINLQAILANFSHAQLVHFGFNMILFYQVSPLIESKIKKSYYMSLLILLIVLTTVGVAQLSTAPTLGFSGIGLGLMVFTGLLYFKNKQISQQLLGWAFLNVLFGLMPGISFAGHFVGALAGLLIFGTAKIIAPKVLRKN